MCPPWFAAAQGDVVAVATGCKSVGKALNLFSCQLIEQLVKRALPISVFLRCLGAGRFGRFSAVFSLGAT